MYGQPVKRKSETAFYVIYSGIYSFEKVVHTIIKYCTDLIVYLIDTVSGSMISEKKVTLLKNDICIAAMRKNSGLYILYNCGRENFELTVSAYGYECRKYKVEYEMLDSNIPMVYIQMIPKLSIKNDGIISELKGNIPGLETIDAVSTEDSFIYFKEFEKEKKILTLFNCLKKPYIGMQYAVVHPEKSEYNVFEIRQELSNGQLITKDIPEKYCIANAMITRVIQGIAEKNGDYVLRLKTESSNQQKKSKKITYIVRYVVNGAEKFQIPDWKDKNLC